MQLVQTPHLGRCCSAIMTSEDRVLVDGDLFVDNKNQLPKPTLLSAEHARVLGCAWSPLPFGDFPVPSIQRSKQRGLRAKA